MSILLDFAQDIIDKYDSDQAAGIKLNEKELAKTPSRTEIINFVLEGKKDTTYLEIGVRNPDHNFNHVKADNKYSVDPGVEFEENPVDFKVTSDDFFSGLEKGKYLKDTLFDAIFIDGLHLAEQVERDINNALRHLKDGGFVLLHDCNPPSDWHAVETYSYKRTPAKGCWNGTTWKAFVKARQRKDISACCIDTDWGIGVVSKSSSLGAQCTVENPYWEYSILDQNRKEVLNLMSFEEFKTLINK